MSNDYKLKWQKDFDAWFDVYSCFILEGLVDDLQPYRPVEGAPLQYMPLYEYLSTMYSSANEKESRRKLVIVYDPTESESMKFQICNDIGEVVEEEPADGAEAPAAPAEGEDTSIDMNYTLRYSRKLSQRFYDILHNGDIDQLLIGHESEGPSLDVAKMHYAVTYDSNRSDGFVARIQEKLSTIFGGGDELLDEETGYLFIIKMTSRLLSRDGEGGGGLSPDELLIFRQLLALAQTLENDEKIRGKHKLVVLANATKDLPKWFVDEANNPYIKILTVSKPDEQNRTAFFDEMIRDDPDHACLTPEFTTLFEEAGREAAANHKPNPFYRKFLGYTNDFSTKQLLHYRDYLKAAPENALSDPAKIGFSVSTFLVGDMTNPWDDEEKVHDLLQIKSLVSRKIQGQDFALDQAQAILRRAALGIDRDENPNAPRAILFLCGPTGTGKTEICKQIAETIFGSEDRIVRFDMSEYGEKESDQKLFGAPPGYVGYEEGGKLTNAVMKEPFSLVLFDEIEKAHNSILDKFLQILGDGRLTSGKGETVRFTDCIIAITSNAGVLSYRDPQLDEAGIQNLMGGDERPEEVNIKSILEMEQQLLDANGEITPADEEAIYNKLKEHLRFNVKAYFHCQLRRPELYGRVEDSIVYYNYIGRNSVLAIVNSKIRSVCRTTETNFSVHINVPDDVRKALADSCQNEHVRGIGARGIIKTTGKIFSTSLAQVLGPYIGEVGGRESLRGRTLTASCPSGAIQKPEDIHWDVA